MNPKKSSTKKAKKKTTEKVSDNKGKIILQMVIS